MKAASRSTWPSICGPAGASRGHVRARPVEPRARRVVIDKPNEYRGFPIRASDDELTQTLVVRINGSVDDPESGYDRVRQLRDHRRPLHRVPHGRSAEALIPSTDPDQVTNSNCLFLGYRMSDWRLRVFLRRVWEERASRSIAPLGGPARPGCARAASCALDAGIALYQSSLVDYVEGLRSVHRRARRGAAASDSGRKSAVPRRRELLRISGSITTTSAGATGSSDAIRSAIGSSRTCAGARLTLLHADSGVGKSSLLRAGVAGTATLSRPPDSLARRGRRGSYRSCSRPGRTIRSRG